ncbi:hypothetical protein VCRA2122O339_140055 [Vibrio crassostreae]|nr:hypothetical protein VCRA2120E331_150055 [Vibrio crassostreae]CAK3219668.1 hypothetical protein VCRA2127O345_150055 [Vibrio crassostreae]CAK3240753.1 hypothetical protein VCRA2122O339_140055 [Vibrio crassostreae]CAK3243858.1 hypothetical protein VCRA2120E330_160056 [Vibrio crassostreae]CAK3259531.1 hypothetical protein VCRA2122O338_150076 [Vibrio crassostreae]
MPDTKKNKYTSWFRVMASDLAAIKKP